MAMVSSIKFTDAASYIVNTIKMYEEYAPRAPIPDWWYGFEDWVSGLEHGISQSEDPPRLKPLVYDSLESSVGPHTHWYQEAVRTFLRLEKEPPSKGGGWEVLARLEPIPGSGWASQLTEEDDEF